MHLITEIVFYFIMQTPQSLSGNEQQKYIEKKFWSFWSEFHPALCITHLFFTSCNHLRNFVKWDLYFLLFKQQVNHISLQVLLIRSKVKMAMATHCHQNNLRFSSFFTSEGFPDGSCNCMSRFWCRYYPFSSSKLYSTCNTENELLKWNTSAIFV